MASVNNIEERLSLIELKKYIITVDGDANTYYPVVIQPRALFPKRLVIYRYYNDKAPDSWNTPTHKGSLVIDLNFILHGWGGAQYYCSGSVTQMYAKQISDIICPGPDTSTLCLMLRGGGAMYTLYSEQNISPKVYLDGYTNPLDGGQKVSPRTNVTNLLNSEELCFGFSSNSIYEVYAVNNTSGIFSVGLQFVRLNTSNNHGNLTINGNITANKVYNAVWNDYAEYFPKGEETEPGDIIALDNNSDKEQYIKADCNSRRVIGVHSDSYGHILGGDKVEDYNKFFEENDKKYIPVGLNGRVYVKVKGPVKIGDYIVPSEEKGIGRALKDGEKSKNIIGYVVEPDNLTEERRVKIFIALGGGK